MRTRRSHKNQDRLFKALFKPPSHATLIRVDEEQFKRFLELHPRAIPDGFKQRGSFIQSRWLDEAGQEIARESSDSQGTIYEIAEERTPVQ